MIDSTIQHREIDVDVQRMGAAHLETSLAQGSTRDA